MNVRFAGLRRIVLAGAIIGAAVGGTVATVIDGMSGPTFWAGIGVGAIVGPICLAALFTAFEFAQTYRRRTPERT